MNYHKRSIQVLHYPWSSSCVLLVAIQVFFSNILMVVADNYGDTSYYAYHCPIGRSSPTKYAVKPSGNLFNEVSYIQISSQTTNNGDPVAWVGSDGAQGTIQAVDLKSGEILRQYTLNVPIEGDWESVGMGPCTESRRGPTCLYFGNVGNNGAHGCRDRTCVEGRATVTIYKLEEPDLSRTSLTEVKLPVATIVADYNHAGMPTVRADSEALFVDPVGDTQGGKPGDLYLVTKFPNAPQLQRLVKVPDDHKRMNIAKGETRAFSLIPQGTPFSTSGKHVWKGGDIAENGSLIALTDGNKVHFFPRPPHITMADAIARPSCVFGSDTDIGGNARQYETVSFHKGAVADASECRRKKSCTVFVNEYELQFSSPEPRLVLPDVTYAPTTSQSPTRQPSAAPTRTPTDRPTASPTHPPSAAPSFSPTITMNPSHRPSRSPSVAPTAKPSARPSSTPSELPTRMPTAKPSASPSARPSSTPSDMPTRMPTAKPSASPSARPSSTPSDMPTRMPSSSPTVSMNPTAAPSAQPSTSPSALPTTSPSWQPSAMPSASPSTEPTTSPSDVPSKMPSMQPSDVPSAMPSVMPSSIPSLSLLPSSTPTDAPSSIPSSAPSKSIQPSDMPTGAPSVVPTISPQPSSRPSEPFFERQPRIFLPRASDTIKTIFSVELELKLNFDVPPQSFSPTLALSDNDRLILLDVVVSHLRGWYNLDLKLKPSKFELDLFEKDISTTRMLKNSQRELLQGSSSFALIGTFTTNEQSVTVEKLDQATLNAFGLLSEPLLLVTLRSSLRDKSKGNSALEYLVGFEMTSAKVQQSAQVVELGAKSPALVTLGFGMLSFALVGFCASVCYLWQEYRRKSSEQSQLDIYGEC
jgi:hypothetical protein